jgi:hypothetical protein
MQEIYKMNTQVFRNFLSIQDLEYIEKKILEPRWSCNHGSGAGGLFWGMGGLESDEFFSAYLLNKIKNLTGDDFEVERIYFNGHTACSQGYPHKDSEEEDGRTFLVYCNKVWDLAFGGNTNLLLDDKVESYFPYPRSAIYFKGNILHCATPVSKNFLGIRVTLAFKLFLKKQ